MSENEGQENIQPRKGIIRREVLKTGAKLLGVVGTLGVLAEEAQAAREGINTFHATFIPFYEVHHAGIDSKSIPPNLDIFFRENSRLGRILYEARPEEVISQTIRLFKTDLPYENENRTERVFEALARNGTTVMFGDVAIEKTLKGIRDLAWVAESLAAGGIVILPRLIARVKEIEGLREGEGNQKGKVPEKPIKAGITRRTFFKGAVAAWLGSQTLASMPGYLLYGAGLVEPFLDQQNALNRIITRLQGLQSNFHPEDFVVFFRNAVIADKLLVVAEMTSSKYGRKAKIGFNVGYGHNGIEDFLKAGRGVCRDVITGYPSSILKRIMSENGGIENFCSIRLFSLPKDFKPDDLRNPNKTQGIQEEKIYDGELMRQLKAAPRFGQNTKS